LYRRESIDAEPGVRWCCGIEGCDYGYDASTKGDWVSDPGEGIRSHTTKEVLPCLNAENHREKTSLAELMSFIFSAAATTEKMSRTGLGLKES